MPNLVPIRRALISVSDKTDLIPLARALAELGIEIVSTGGTAAALIEGGLTVLPIDRVTGFPEMMNGRVKTLHPAIHGALLGRRDDPGHLAAMEAHGITPIDLVCVNLYPFERTLSEDLPREEAVELIDIGGPSMVRSGAKNHDFVAVVTSPSQYDRVVTELQGNDGATTFALRSDLAAAAFSRTAEYDAAISAWMCGRSGESFPPMFRISQTKQEMLRYGENPHQRAALYHDPAARGSDIVSAELLHGKPLSYNNINDAAAALDLVRDQSRAFPDRAVAAIIKHTNPCGAAIAHGLAEAFINAHEGDPTAAFGGILALNHVLDTLTAKSICDGTKFFEVIIAPGFDDDATALLAERWKNVRLLDVGPFATEVVSSVEFKSVPGGLLVQERDRALADTSKWTHAAGPTPDEALLASAGFLWIVTKHLRSNAVAVGGPGQLFGAGAGQMDRVTAARLAIEKAGDRLRGTSIRAVAASDGFFPFPDGPELLIDAGVTCIVQPGGSKRDQETLDLCRDRGVTCLLTGARHFKH